MKINARDISSINLIYTFQTYTKVVILKSINLREELFIDYRIYSLVVKFDIGILMS